MSIEILIRCVYAKKRKSHLGRPRNTRIQLPQLTPLSPDIVPQPNPESQAAIERLFPNDDPLFAPFISQAPVNITVPPGATAQFK